MQVWLAVRRAWASSPLSVEIEEHKRAIRISAHRILPKLRGSLCLLYLSEAKNEVESKKARHARKLIDLAISNCPEDSYVYGAAADLYVDLGDIPSALYLVRRGEEWAASGDFGSDVRAIFAHRDMYINLTEAIRDQGEDPELTAEMFVRILFSRSIKNPGPSDWDVPDETAAIIRFAEFMGIDEDQVSSAIADRIRQEFLKLK